MFPNTIEINEIFSGIYQLKMPLPFRLNHINLYLLKDYDGWYLIDTGLNTDVSKTLWENFINSPFFTKPIKKIILTHLHPDHIGMSAWLSKTLEVPVSISENDWNMANFLWKNDTHSSLALYKQYWSNFGIPETQLPDMLALRTHYKKLVKELPESVEILPPYSLLSTESGNWKLIPASGHSPEHLCLWNDQQKILISGDHLLPHITPNISLHPTGLENPLESYLQSLEEFKRLECDYYLPAHGAISQNYHERIEEIVLHHQKKFAVLMNNLEFTNRVFDAMPLIFDANLPPQQLMFAYAETAAHLVCLAARGLLKRDASNPWVFINPYHTSNLHAAKYQHQLY